MENEPSNYSVGTMKEYATEKLRPYADDGGWLCCFRHTQLVMPKGHDRSIVKKPPADGMCYQCCREWIETYGDTAAKWALDQLKQLEAEVGRGEYDFSQGAAQAGYDEGFREGQQYEREDR